MDTGIGGVLVGLGVVEVVIRKETRVGEEEIRVHFPRRGFRVVACVAKVRYYTIREGACRSDFWRVSFSWHRSAKIWPGSSLERDEHDS